MQLGFVIDHSRCIGCHACTVACKAENDVPLGSFRTWVKYTERGTFPEVRRSFAVLRCNQCTDAPCVTICPVRALAKRPDGIVDVDPAACIGCKACMQGCPYDALYLNEAKGTAEKCHFCAHRTEIGLAPACAVVCPTEAIVPGDLDDPDSVVSRMRREHRLQARKPEAGTGPNVFYRDVEEAGIDPLATSAAGGYLWAEQLPGVNLDAERFQRFEREAERRARTTYDVDHRAWWGLPVSAYLFTKSLAAGIFLALALSMLPGLERGDPGRVPALLLSLAALGFLGLTTALLVLDLKRPLRFLYVLTRPNWDSWLARGSLVLAAYGFVLTAWCAFLRWGVAAEQLPRELPQMAGLPGSVGDGTLRGVLLVAGAVLAALTACYTGWLFGQAKGRVLWMRRGLWLHLIVQALVAGAAFVLLLGRPLELPRETLQLTRGTLVVALVLHGLFVLGEGLAAPARRKAEYARALRLIKRGPFALRHWAIGVGIGIVLPLAELLLAAPWTWPAAGALALVGLFVEEDVLVRAGQALSIS